MKRILGIRPTEVRELIGWEWAIESWLAEEAEGRALESVRRYDA
jgi:hypothetical protein